MSGIAVADAVTHRGMSRFARGEIVEYLTLGIQVLLALLVVRQFRLESRTFYDVALLLSAGFVVHAILPLRYRLSFFAGLSMAAIGIAFGAREGLTLVAVGVVLIALCHVPVRFAARVGLVAVAGLVLAACRARLLPDAWLGAGAWAILGSMFMFRLAVYLHALATAGPNDPKPTIARTFAYFFMAPNVCFPLFPVVDYATFAKNYYDRPAVEIYQTGAKWVVRGLVHLLLYRLVYQRMANDPTELAHLGDLLQYLFSTYLLYLRVSGSFHLIIGLLCLFGFRLPETHHLFYLASSINDYWRRINIYWKDFMMKLVYMPSFFVLRGKGNTLALIGASASVFVATWLLHSYQWFWLRGGFLLTAPDTLFWGILGALVIWNALRESKRGRKRLFGKQPVWSFSLAWKTVLTFTTLLILWSLWSAESVLQWLTMWFAATRVRPIDVAILAGILVAGFAIAGHGWGASATVADNAVKRPWYRHQSVPSIATLVVLLLLGQPEVNARFGHTAASVLNGVKESTLNARDIATQHKGYYEKLDSPGRMSANLWNLQAKRPPDWVEVARTPIYVRSSGNFLEVVYRPSTQVYAAGVNMTTNRWGMRDRDYEQQKPQGTFRIAMLGSSYLAGTGVPDDQVADQLIEAQLNRELAARPGAHSRYEVLNFAVSGYSLLDQMFLFEQKVVGFEPDVVVITLDQLVERWTREKLLRLVWDGTDVRYGPLRDVLQRLELKRLRDDGIALPFAVVRDGASLMGVRTRMPWQEGVERMRTVQPEVVRFALRQIVQTARSHGAVPVLLGLDVVTGLPAKAPAALDIAREEGFLVIDMFDVYDKHPPESLRIAEWDDHPNAFAHRLIADRLHGALMRHADSLSIVTSATALAPASR